MSPERLESLQTSGAKLLEQYAVAPADAYRSFDALVAAYSAPERHYHNLEHLGEMFRVAGRLAPNTDNPAAVQLAIWFHDVVYNTRAKDNEARSAELAAGVLGPLGVPAAVIKRMARLIRATAHLTSADLPSNRDAAVLLDADLAILGATEQRYRSYSSDIRRSMAWCRTRITEWAAWRC